MTRPSGDNLEPGRRTLTAAIDTANRLWNQASQFVSSRLVWNRLYRTASYLKSALWVVPFVAILLVLATAPALRTLDAWLGWRISGLGPAGATSLYQTVITLTLSFVVFTFGSLLVAIQVASGQLTPRIIATTLLRDNVVRYSVGLFVFTLVFAVMALNRLSTTVNEIVPLVAPCSASPCMADVLFLIDYAARLLRPVSVVARVGDEGLAVIDAVYPSEVGATADEGHVPFVSHDGAPAGSSFTKGTSAIVLAVELDVAGGSLARLADGVIEFLPQVGDFVASGRAVVRAARRRRRR